MTKPMKGQKGLEGSRAKAEELKAHLHDWTATTEEDGDSVSLVATRGDEVVTMVWSGGRCLGGNYALGERCVSVRNASAARQIFATPAEQSLNEGSRIKARKVRHDVVADNSLKSDVIPQHLSDEEIIALVTGKTVYWRNATSGLMEHGKVMHSNKQHYLTIQRKANGRRILSFCADKGPYRALYLDSIVAIS